MSGDFVGVDIGSALPYLVETVKEIFGHDEHSKEIRELVDNRVKRSYNAANRILIAGMSTPLQLDEAYQLLRLSKHQDDCAATTTVDDIIRKSGNSAIFFAPPGRGKSVTLQHAYMLLASGPGSLPLLYLLREPKTLGELTLLIEELLHKGRKKQVSKAELVVLLDGYDEIDYAARKSLSAVLRDLEGIENARFIMTCRTYYEIIDLRVERYYLQPFTVNDSLAFLAVLLAKQGSEIKASDLLSMMNRRGFSDFTSNPLFMALSVLLQRGVAPRVPRNAIKLLDDVVDYLAFHWDDERGVDRKIERHVGDSELSELDGKDLLKCLKRIAARFEDLEGSQHVAEAEVREQLELMQANKIEPRSLLMELARWFGLFVPGENLKWSFVHRAVHEYLAAKFMVESGNFSPAEARKNWRRAHYAACFMTDATRYIVQALESSRELEMFVECSANDAYFYSVNVAQALIKFYEKPLETCTLDQNEVEKHILVCLEQDYLDVVKTPFLQHWVELASTNREYPRGAAISLALALSELHKRRECARNFDRIRFGDYRWTVTRSGLAEINTFTSKDIPPCFKGSKRDE